MFSADAGGSLSFLGRNVIRPNCVTGRPGAAFHVVAVTAWTVTFTGAVSGTAHY